MSDTKILQALLNKVSSVDKKVDGVKEVVKDTKESLTKRIDKLGQQIANSEDDSTIIEELDKLEKRVTKLETAVKN